MSDLTQINFPRPYRHQEVATGESAIIWEMNVSGGYVGFIKTVFIRFFDDTYLEFKVDGVHVEGSKIEHDLGSLDSPVKFDPPLVAHNTIRVVAFNNSSATIDFEAKITGILAKPKT